MVHPLKDFPQASAPSMAESLKGVKERGRLDQLTQHLTIPRSAVIRGDVLEYLRQKPKA